MNKRSFNVSEARRRNRLKTIKKWASTLFFLFFILVGVAYGWNFVVRPKLAEKNLKNTQNEKVRQKVLEEREYKKYYNI